MRRSRTRCSSRAARSGSTCPTSTPRPPPRAATSSRNSSGRAAARRRSGTGRELVIVTSRAGDGGVQAGCMNPVKLVLGFVPFIVFTVLSGWVPVGWAAAAGLVAALAVVAVTAGGGIKVLPLVQAGVLLVIAVLGFAAGPATVAFLTVYGRGLASLALGSFIVATAARTPFTAQFARAAVPESAWHTPGFLRVNRRISLAWGYVVLVLGACHLVGAFLAVQHAHPLLRLLVDWGVPVLAFLRVTAYTRRTAAATSSH